LRLDLPLRRVAGYITHRKLNERVWIRPAESDDAALKDDRLIEKVGPRVMRQDNRRNAATEGRKNAG